MKPTKCYPITEVLYKSVYSCDHQWTLQKEIGTDGTYGEIWSVCCNDKCDYVLKYMPFDKENTEEGITKELTFKINARN